jgi:hypothetical protein
MIAETSGGLTILLRTSVAADEPYAMSCAVRTVLSGPAYRGMSAKDLRAIERDLRARWRDGGRDRVVACLPDDESFIMGFAFGLRAVPVLDYVHVRGSFTGQGLGTLLAATLGVTREAPAFVDFDTTDLSRPQAEGSLPIGLLNSGRWPRLSLRRGH